MPKNQNRSQLSDSRTKLSDLLASARVHYEDEVVEAPVTYEWTETADGVFHKSLRLVFGSDHHVFLVQAKKGSFMPPHKMEHERFFHVIRGKIECIRHKAVNKQGDMIHVPSKHTFGYRVIENTIMIITLNESSINKISG